MQVRIGGYAVRSDPASAYEERHVIKTLVHPQYNTDASSSEHWDNDVAVLLLNQPSTIPPVKLMRYTRKRCRVCEHWHRYYWQCWCVQGHGQVVT